ncbi:PQQ-binding-like beta-propeller repeat protein [Demetria terragena]|uniref:PQQ-binding-like beta-propeller repeat protein n=1 Tax=Demetria terragena TaxID=63959 RepID=UPI0003616980|nr:PQQ-binding-like beta-propeller repeat protein [Demetria terragena]
MLTSVSRTRRLVAAVATLPLLAACGSHGASSDSSSPGDGNAASSSAAASSSNAPTKTGPTPGSGEREVAKVAPRVLISGEGGGLTLIDGTTGKVVEKEDLPGFNRLSDAGDGRRVMVSTSKGFQVYDTGIEEQPHGDHNHAYEYEPGLTSVRYPASHPGHVVAHGGKTVLFGDGAGTIQIVPTEQVGSTVAPIQKTKTASAHHGVALVLKDGTMLTTQGTEEKRSTVEARKNGKVVTKTTDCLGVHGETTAADEAVLFGCEDGPVIYRDGTFHKVAVKDSFARSGNVAGTHESPIVLADYKTDKDAELERPTQVALIDTRTDKLSLVELGSSYWFRSLARGPEGEALVVTYDGKLVVIDSETGKISKRIPAIDAWKEKKDWQDPGPSIKVADDQAFITDAAKKQLVVVDLESGKVVKRHSLPVTPVEIAVTTGEPAHDHEDESGEGPEGHDHEGHDDEGHDHEH